MMASGIAESPTDGGFTRTMRDDHEILTSTRKSLLRAQAFPVPKSAANLLPLGDNAGTGRLNGKRGKSMATVPEYKSLSILAREDQAQ
jgi:hypothetical protein